MLLRRAVVICFALVVASGTSVAQAPAKKPSAAVSEVLKAKRPLGGEYFGLYLMNQKVGYIFQDLGYLPGSSDKVRARTEFVFKANVGGNRAERTQKEIRIYEARPKGRLLSFTVEQRGDGGDQTLEATATPQGLTVLRRRPGLPNQVLQLPPSREVVEDADQVRLAALLGKRIEGVITDAQDLQAYQVTSTPKDHEERLLGGVKVKLRRVVTLSDKEKTPVDVYLADSGEVMEMKLGSTMSARAEPEGTAKRLDVVGEVFALTRVVLPRSLSAGAHQLPGKVTYVMTGLPEKFQVNGTRQSFKKLGQDRVEVTVVANLPDPTRLKPLASLRDPHGGIYLKSNLMVESDNSDIQALARRLTEGEKNAFDAARKIIRWVDANLENAYGASSDRATDVLRARKGDCTEHSLLTVALMRAAGIPSKRVDGLIYMVNDDGVPALYWHEWVEAYVGEWLQMDPTFGQEVATAGRFAAGEEGNAEILPLIGELKVVEVR